MHRRWTAIAAVIGTLLGPGALPMTTARAEPLHQRINLMAAPDDELDWSFDADDPALQVSPVAWDCGLTLLGTRESKACAVTRSTPEGRYGWTIYFQPASILDQPLTWSAASPLRFHLALHVDAPLPYSIHVGVQKGIEQTESATATQVAPDVFEGTMTRGAPLDQSTMNIMFFRIQTDSSFIRFELQTRGASYIELPEPVAAHSVPDLVTEDTYRPDPSTYSSPQRWFSFNDRNWEVVTFTGNLASPAAFDFTLDHPASVVYAWVEAWKTPVVQDALRGKGVDRSKLMDGPYLQLFRGDERLEYGSGGSGRGMDALAVNDVGVGPLRLTVDPVDQSSTDVPYTAYVLEVFGSRTLRSMRWVFTENSFVVSNYKQCGGETEPIPTTEEVRTYSMDLTWDTESLPMPKWTFSYSLPGVGDFQCGEAGAATRKRITFPSDAVWWVGATPTHDAQFVSLDDTVFTMRVDFTYSAPPVTGGA